jgi:recombination associated protein RdgC
MFFKNITLYQLTEDFRYSSDELQAQLAKDIFMPCPKSENFSLGWVSPFGLDSEVLVHALAGYYLIAFCKEEKILPGSVIKEELEKKLSLIEKAEDRLVYRKEKKELRDQIIINLRHQAFSRKKIILAYIDTHSNYLVIDSSSRNKAEELCSFLRKTLGSLKLALPQTKSKPENIMTSWLLGKENLPSFVVQNNCEMLDPKQKTAMIKCKEHDLNTDEILSHLHTGKQIVKLALKWQDKISFDLSEDLAIRRIKFLELIQEQRKDTKHQSDKEQLDTEFAIMTGEFSQFLQDLWPLFDGLTATEN